MLLELIRRLPLSGGQDRCAPDQILELRRSWPVDADHLLLEYRTHEGMLLPGRWSRHAAELEQLAAAVGRSSGLRPILVQHQGQSVLLQPQGVDARLRGLTALLRSQHCQLLSHRPGKRAVVRWQGADGPLYGKLFASGRAFRRAALSFEHAFRILGDRRSPKLLRRLPHLRALLLSSVDGTSLHDQLCRGGIGRGDGEQIGETLRALQAIAASPHLQQHRGEDEARLLSGWLPHSENFLPQWSTRIREHCEVIRAGLCEGPQTAVLAHRDLHDKQILLTQDRQPGLIDFDTMAMADPALDPANLLAHLELRQLQGLCSGADRLAIADALLRGYGASPQGGHLQIYLDAARLRLACVYGFRPRWQALIDPMLGQIGQSWDCELRGGAGP